MSDVSTPRGPRRPLRPAAAVLAAILVVVAGIVVYVERGSLPGPRPDTGEGITPGPVTSGQVVVPASPGATSVVSADTMRFHRPTFEYRGSGAWQIRNLPDSGRVLEAYASRPSYLPGETLRIAVSTTAPTFEGTIFRVSGRAPFGSPFEEVGKIDRHPGRRQRAPTVDPVTKLVAARWDYDVSYPVPAGWPSGMYLVRLASSQDVQSYVPFVVRSPAAHRILVVSSAMNWEAYNTWGGSSVYETRVGDPLPGVHRALGVSFDRPYANDDGSGQLFFLELPFISWIKRQGLDVAFTTDYDLSVNPDGQPMPKVVVFNGHDEYWGVPLYDWLDRHVNEAGDLGLAMLAADTGYWPVSFTQQTADGPRDFLVFKNGPVPVSLGGTSSPAPSEEPSGSPEASGTPEPSGGGEDVEERGRTVIQAFPSQGPYVGSYAGQPIFGVHYNGVTTELGRYTLERNADARLLANTGLQPGGSLGFIAGGEVDAVDDVGMFGGPLGGRYDHVFAAALQIPGRANHRWTAQAVWRELPNGGRVFSSGTFYWGWALDPNWGASHAVPAGFGRLTLNILAFLAGG